MNSFYESLLPVPLNSGFQMNDYWVWCASVMEEPGKGFHLYGTRWPKKYPMFAGYIYLSEIIHAFSENMTGPYKFIEKVLPSGNSNEWDGRMVHNPTVCKYNDRYLMYYIGTTYEEPVPLPEKIPETESQRAFIYSRIKIGLAISATLEGPWERLDHPILDSRQGYWDSILVTNPAPCVLPDGKIFLYYRSNTPNGLRIGLAVADKPEGPYCRIQNEPVMNGIDVEDPFVWHNGDHFEMIAKDMTGIITGEVHAGAHFISNNGIDWTSVANPKAYSRTIIYTDNTQVTLGSLERPQLLFDYNGNPKCLFAAAADGSGGFNNASRTWNIAIPMETI